MNPRAMIGACAAAALAAGCGGDRLSGPPTLRLGRDECAECGMLISEDRCSGAFLVEAGGAGGRREHVLFDDVGCMLDWEHAHAATTPVLSSFVHDHGTRAWVDGPAARFLLTDPQVLATPMGSGIAAFSDPAEAERRRVELGGRVLALDGLRPARRAWMEARYGTPGESR